MTRFLTRLQPWTLFLLRIAVGVAMLYNSWDKVLPRGRLPSRPLSCSS